jgi:NADH-quinone oxidoreductase subunit K
MVPLTSYLVLSGILFGIGILGVVIKRNAIVVFMSIELMLNAVNLTFVAFSSYLKSLNGQIFVFMVMVVAAAEVVVGLALIIAIVRLKRTTNIDEINLMKW